MTTSVAARATVIAAMATVIAAITTVIAARTERGDSKGAVSRAALGAFLLSSPSLAAAQRNRHDVASTAFQDGQGHAIFLTARSARTGQANRTYCNVHVRLFATCAARAVWVPAAMGSPAWAESAEHVVTLLDMPFRTGATGRDCEWLAVLSRFA